jgi:hypothetical protein
MDSHWLIKGLNIVYFTSDLFLLEIKISKPFYAKNSKIFTTKRTFTFRQTITLTFILHLHHFTTKLKRLRAH